MAGQNSIGWRDDCISRIDKTAERHLEEQKKKKETP